MVVAVAATVVDKKIEKARNVIHSLFHVYDV